MLASPASDAAHPAFSNLCVRTEYVSAHDTLLATRRPRAADAPALWVGHAGSAAGAQRYKVEPYVMAGDVYGEPPHIGRGGWTWYTGSAGWMYRAVLEWILGFRLRGKRLVIDPCIPRAWPSFATVFRYHSSTYEIIVDNPNRACPLVSLLDLDGGQFEAGSGIPLADDGKTHRVRVVLGLPSPRPATEPASPREHVANSLRLDIKYEGVEIAVEQETLASRDDAGAGASETPSARQGRR